MQFKHPQLLYALLLLIIPIIVHLFQLRKFKVQHFTNVAFLKKIKAQTRKSARLKKWLILCTRLGLLTALILAFAQPYLSKTNTITTASETVLYLDNSFSMQAKGEQGELLKRTVQDILSYVPYNEKITLVTNTATYKNTTIKELKNELLQLDYSSTQLPYKTALLKSKQLFSKEKNTIKNLIFISDFQQKNTPFPVEKDTLYRLHLITKTPVSKNNSAIDSVYISKRNRTHIELTVALTYSGSAPENIPVSLHNNNELLSKTSVNLKNTSTTVFTVPSNTPINGRITIDDPHLKFDNTLFFTLDNTKKINVLTLNGNASDDFLKRIFTKDEFNYSSTAANSLNYNTITSQNLIVLNELEAIPNALINSLLAFTEHGGYLIVIPPNNAPLSTYNTLLTSFGHSPFQSFITTEKRLTTINFSHPIYSDDVFEKKVTNFQYPKIQSYYVQNNDKASSVLQFENGHPLLSHHLNTYIFTSALNTKNSNIQNSPLIVPTFYSIAKNSLNYSKLYYTIGTLNTYDVPVALQKNTILELATNTHAIIPKQNYFNTKITITTDEIPEKAATYAIKNKKETVGHASYNYKRDESMLVYLDTNAHKKKSIEDVFNTIKSDRKVNTLWKWFAIFALLLLIVEMLILKYFK